MNDRVVTLHSIEEASRRLAGIVHRTPILENRHLNQLSGNRLFLKGEHLQKGGSFKYRGAENAISQLSSTQLKRGVITQSSGNHAQAVALAAARRGCPAQIVIPSNAPKPKIAAVRDYGAEITFCAPVASERVRVMQRLQTKLKATYIPPYDHPSIISGQGTIGLELIDQTHRLDVVVAPVGGGGLLSGIASAIKALSPETRVYGAEPAGADDAARSLEAGMQIPQSAPRTIADGLLTSLGDSTWPLIQRKVDGIQRVEEAEIVQSMIHVWQWTKQIIEPSAAVAIAAVLSAPFREKYQNASVAVVLSGGNVDLRALPWL